MVRTIGTRFVAMFDAGDGVRLTCTWAGGPIVTVYAAAGDTLRMVASWNVWNEAWGCPLFRHDGEAFEHYCRLRLSEPGAVDELLEELPA